MCACVFVVCLLCCVVLSSPISNTVTITFVETDTCVHKKIVIMVGCSLSDLFVYFYLNNFFSMERQHTS